MEERFGPYQLLKLLGSGAMGDAHLARPLDAGAGLPSPLVIKRLHGGLALQEDFLRRFRHEAEIATLIESPHVARIFDVGRVDEVLYIAMEYISGWPVSRIIESLASTEQRASIASALDLTCGALAGLAAIHEARDASGQHLGIVHRDISPKNLMLGEDGLTRVIDLGLGKSRLQDWKTRTGALMGTVGYMPPEQVSGGTVDHRVDLYAAVVVLWELLTGAHYIERDKVVKMLLASSRPQYRPPSSLRPEVPQALDAILERALAPDPDARFQTAAELLRALREAVPAPAQARPEGWSLIGQMLWSELSHSRVEVKKLLDTPPPPAPSVATMFDDNTIVLARRTAPRTLMPADTEVRPRAPSVVPRPRSTTRIVVASALGGAAVVLGVQALLSTTPKPEPPAPVPLVEARPRASARAVEAPAPHPPPAGDGEPAVETAPRTAAARRAGDRGLRSAAVPAGGAPERAAPSAADPVAAPGSPPAPRSALTRAPDEPARAWVDRLSKAALAQLAAGPSSTRRAELARILGDLNRYASSPRLEHELAAVEALARRLEPGP